MLNFVAANLSQLFGLGFMVLVGVAMIAVTTMGWRSRS